ncbi:Maf family nucleotide pyrophosphatase [Crocinitomicaceae bacterium]|nr:Maf family nucleotide pyrophosphatase [Crocinitomicaceae bacterium]
MHDIKLVLGSKSPRRQSLIKELGFNFEIRTKETEEIYPKSLDINQVPEYLAKLKAEALIDSLNEGEILLTSDTVVIYNERLLGKPKDAKEAFEMLQTLKNSSHKVITGVNLISLQKSYSFSTQTEVFFSDIDTLDINTYIDNHKPFDKAGSYGIQEWLGYIGVEKIEGCYYNVMGLPLHDVYKALKLEFLPQ